MKKIGFCVCIKNFRSLKLYYLNFSRLGTLINEIFSLKFFYQYELFRSL